MLRWLVGALLLWMPSTQWFPETHTLTVEGVERTYHVYAPRAIDDSQPVPLLIVLHGGGGNGRQIMRFTGFNAVARERQFIVVYPEGIDNHWNDGRTFRNAPTGVNDVAFIRALIDQLEADYHIDPNHIFATGISNGGFMSYRLACDLSDRIAGVAPVAAALSVDLSETCQPTRPVKMLIINGTDDPLVPYDGGNVTLVSPLVQRGAILSTADTLNFWAANNGCTAVPVTVDGPDVDPEDGLRIQITTCDSGVAPVRLYTVLGGGHTWPGAAQYLPVNLVGRVSHDIDATRAIWDFFAGTGDA